MADTQTEGVKVDYEELRNFDERCTRKLQDLLEIQQVWKDALSAGVQIPYDAYCGGKYENLAQGGYVDGEYKLDEEATLKEIAKVVQWAADRHYSVEKKMDDDYFEVFVHTPAGTFEFRTTRQVTCKKVVVGTEVVPAQEEKVVEKFEWVCEKIAFLSIDID